MPIDDHKRAEIEAQRAALHETRRATVPALEAILYERFDVLDHGFVRVIDYMGDDAAIVQAVARNHEKITGSPPSLIGAHLPMSYSAGDSCWLWKHGIPCLHYGPGGGFLDPGPDGSYIFISEMVTCAEVLAHTAMDMCGTA